MVKIKKHAIYKPVPTILVLAWPVVIEMALHTFVWIFDTAMVMRLGARESTAVEYGAVLIFTTLHIFAALGIGANALVARYTGARDPEKAASLGGQALGVGLLITFALIGLGYAFGGKFIATIMDDSITRALTEDYFYMTLLSGGVTLLPMMIANGIIRGTGNTRLPMLISLIINVYNIVGDYILIFGKLGFPAMGVKGAALATGSAQLIGCFLSLGYLFWCQKELPIAFRHLFPLRGDNLRQMLELSAPSAGEELVWSGSRLLSSTWLTAMGAISFAANAAAVAGEAFSFMPGQAFAIVATTLVGQRLGAAEPLQARATGYWAAMLSTALMSVFSMVFLFFPYAIMAVFNPPQAEVLHLGARCLQFAALEQPFIALTMVFSGALKGAGDARTPFMAGLLSNLVIRLPLIYIVVYHTRLDITYIWLITALQYAASSVMLFAAYRRKKWEQISRLPAPGTTAQPGL